MVEPGPNPNSNWTSGATIWGPSAQADFHEPKGSTMGPRRIKEGLNQVSSCWIKRWNRARVGLKPRLVEGSNPNLK